MARDPHLQAWLAKRDAVFRNLTLETATAWWNENKNPAPLDPSVPLAATHKARLQWLGATDAMLAESRRWLERNGYSTSYQGEKPLTPERRDKERAEHGMPPLEQV